MKKTLVLGGAAVLMVGMSTGANAQSSKAMKPVKVMTTLSGMAERPHGDAHGTGSATVNLYPATHKVCYSLTVKGVMGKALAAHIHKGKAGVSGPVVVTLNTPGMNGRSTGCAKPSMMLFNAMMKSPSSFYVNVHTKEYAAGAVRGQL